MITIRAPQLEVLGAEGRTQLEAWIREHVEQYLPERCRRIGEPNLVEAIRFAIGRAERHGLREHTDIARFVDLMFVFGVFMEEDPANPFIGALLSGMTPENASGRMRLLFDLGCAQAATGVGLDPRELPLVD